MPIAVQRLTGAQLPVTLRLDDSNSMAGQKLSAASSVIVAVQVSRSGRPGEANARWLGQAGPVAPSVDDTPSGYRAGAEHTLSLASAQVFGVLPCTQKRFFAFLLYRHSVVQ